MLASGATRPQRSGNCAIHAPIPALVEATRDEQPDVRLRAIARARRDARPAFERGAHRRPQGSGCPRIRAKAAAALGEIGDRVGGGRIDDRSSRTRARRSGGARCTHWESWGTPARSPPSPQRSRIRTSTCVARPHSHWPSSPEGNNRHADASSRRVTRRSVSRSVEDEPRGMQGSRVATLTASLSAARS